MPTTVSVSLSVNGNQISQDVEPRMLLVQFVREVAGLTATNIGCDTTSCGACTVLLDGESVKSCTVLAAQADGRDVTTLEGLAEGDRWHAVQTAFREQHGLQCGFCTPGMVMAAVSLLEEQPNPTEAQVREGLEGNLCRCTGYHNIVQAVLAAARLDERFGLEVIPAAFDYVRADTLDAALAVLAEHGDEAKLLAGGHSLLPLMKLRLATPAVLVDVGRLTELSYIRAEGDEIAVGALTRHHDLATSDVLAAYAPLLRAAAATIGDPQVRHRGTIGGSLVHGDPASDLPAVALAGQATLVVSGPQGERRVQADDFFTGFLETAVAPDEVLVEVRLPKTGPTGWSFQKFTKRSQDWAIVGVAAARVDGRVGVGLVNMDSRPVRASAVEAALAAGSSAADAVREAAGEGDPPADLAASVEYRRHLASVLVGRALAEVGEAG